MIEKQYTVRNNEGLHARPASLLVQAASQSKSKVTLIKEDKEYNAKSVLGIISMAASNGTVVTIKIEGPDEVETDAKIMKLFQTNFGE